MPSTPIQKLKIREGFTLLTIHAPNEFRNDLGELPPGIKITTTPHTYHQIHWFVKNKSQLEAEVKKVIGLLKDEVVCWIYFPKGTSKVQTDLTRDNGWESLLSHRNLQLISLVSFNDTWSAFGVRLETEADRKRAAKPKMQPISEYIDAKTRTIRLPQDLSDLLQKNKKEAAFFETLSFTNKKEYVEWIVSAKREETRHKRLIESMDRLKKGWKNPANR